MTTTALAIIQNTLPSRRDLAAQLAALSDEAITFLSYEASEMPEFAHVPCWVFDACYDEGDRRMEAKLRAGTHPAFPGRVFTAAEL